MKKLNFTKGFSVIAIIIVTAAVIVVFGGVYYYYNNRHVPAISPINNSTSNNPISGKYSGNACNYFTLDIAKEILGSDAEPSPGNSTDTAICGYVSKGKMNGVATATVVMISDPSKAFFDSVKTKAVKSTIINIDGIGEEAFLQTYTPINSIAVYSYKKGLTIYSGGGHDVEFLKNLIKKVVDNIN